jgi:hypothetical protein
MHVGNHSGGVACRKQVLINAFLGVKSKFSKCDKSPKHVSIIADSGNVSWPDIATQQSTDRSPHRLLGQASESFSQL